MENRDQRAVFLDRDGVLTEAIVRDNRAYAPVTLDEFRLVEDAAMQVARLRAAGFLCIVFTNQPEIARGMLSKQTLDAMHHRLRTAVELDDLLVCEHDSSDGCPCHKPKPGMILSAAARWKIALQGSFVIGDRWRDVEAGRAAECYTVLIERPYSRCSTADVSVDNLSAAVDTILKKAARA
jgi:D-glycero-D-manno-heptose 1,7-bisphosphate phosphatase